MLLTNSGSLITRHKTSPVSANLLLDKTAYTNCCGEEVMRDLLFSFVSVISITYRLMSWAKWTFAVSYPTCSPSILVLRCLIYYYFSGGEYVN